MTKFKEVLGGKIAAISIIWGNAYKLATKLGAMTKYNRWYFSHQ